MTFREFMAENGYTCQTTFWEDFTIADKFGPDAVRDTYERAFEEWHENVVYITEMVLVLNHKIVQHYQHNDALATLYDELWRRADSWCCDNLTDDDLNYFYNTTD